MANAIFYVDQNGNFYINKNNDYYIYKEATAPIYFPFIYRDGKFKRA